jgi:hypothetical protein
VAVSLPFKLIFFVLVDGWSLVAGAWYRVMAGSSILFRDHAFDRQRKGLRARIGPYPAERRRNAR